MFGKRTKISTSYLGEELKFLSQFIDWFENLECLPNWYWSIKYFKSNMKRYFYIKKFPPGTLIKDCSYRPCINL